jgi:hypothetical protein
MCLLNVRINHLKNAGAQSRRFTVVLAPIIGGKREKGDGC